MSWNALTAAVGEARGLIAQAAPDDETRAEGDAYVTRVLAATLTPAVLGGTLREDGLSRPLPCHGGPNPDYIMRHAPVQADGRYRLEGRINGSERVGIGLYSFDATGAAIELGYAAFDQDFAIDIAADPGPGGLVIRPEARVLLIRVLHRDSTAEPARLCLTGVPASPGLARGSDDAILAFVAGSVVRTVRQFLAWTAAVGAHPNAFAPPPPELAGAVQGDPDTLYFLGSFDLAEGEWLEAVMPVPNARYWSIHAYDHWFQPLGVPGVDDRNAVTEDGDLRIRIGPDAPAEASNRIDTAGRRRGSLICRIIGNGSCPRTFIRRS